MAEQKILVVDNDPEIANLVSSELSREEFIVEEAPLEPSCVITVADKSPALTVLRLLEPEAVGFEVLTELMAAPRTRDIPVIITSDSDKAELIVKALELGAYDFIVTPVNQEVLAARIKSALKKHAPTVQEGREVVKLGKLSIDPIRHEVTIDSGRVELTAGEFDLLYFLARQKGRVFTRSQIIERLHGPDYGVAARSVDVHLVGIRDKLGSYAKCLETVRGVGYRFTDEMSNGRHDA